MFYKDTEQNGPLLLKGEPIVPSPESRAEQIGPLSMICDQFVLINPSPLVVAHLFLLVSRQKALSFRFATRGRSVLYFVFTCSASLLLFIFWYF